MKRIVYLESGIKCLQANNFFIMGIDELPYKKSKPSKITGARWDKKLNQTIYFTHGWKLYRIYDESRDPNMIAIKPYLHKSPLFPDYYVDGALLSDFRYFKEQKELYRKSLTFQYYKLTNNKFLVKKWLTKALKEFDDNILKRRGVDISIDEPLSENDKAILDYIEKLSIR